MSGARNRHADYHANPALGGSRVARIVGSCLAEAFAPVEVTRAMVMGSCVDAVFVVQMSPESVFAVAPDVPKRSKADKARHAAHEAACAKRGIYSLTVQEATCVQNALKSLQMNAVALKVQESCGEQTQMFWEEPTPHGPVACKGMTDFLGVWLADLKGYTNAFRSVLGDCRFRHPYQLAHYRRGARAHGIDPKACAIIATPMKGSASIVPASVIQISDDRIDEAEGYLVNVIYPAVARLKAGEPVWTGYINRGDSIEDAAPLLYVG